MNPSRRSWFLWIIKIRRPISPSYSKLCGLLCGTKSLFANPIQQISRGLGTLRAIGLGFDQSCRLFRRTISI